MDRRLLAAVLLAFFSLTAQAAAQPSALELTGGHLTHSRAGEPATVELTIENRGAPLMLQGMGIMSAEGTKVGATDVSVAGSCVVLNDTNQPLATGASCQVALTLTPDRPGKLRMTFCLLDYEPEGCTLVWGRVRG